MKVKDLIKQLQKLPQDTDIVITSLDDNFYCTEFEVHSPIDDGVAQEIILPCYIEDYNFDPSITGDM